MQQHERLRRARLDAGFKTGTEAAMAMGIAVATYNAHENGHRGLSVRTAEAYSKQFSVRASWLLTGEEPMRYAEDLSELDRMEEEIKREQQGIEYGTYVPGRPYFAASPSTLPEIDIWSPKEESDAYEVVGEWTFPGDFIAQVLRGTPRNLFLVNSSDDTMAPAISEGDRAIIDSAQVSFRGDGLYAIADSDGQIHIRWLNKVVVNPSPDGNIGVSTNKPAEVYFTSLQALTVVGKVVGKIGKV